MSEMREMEASGKIETCASQMWQAQSFSEYQWFYSNETTRGGFGRVSLLPSMNESPPGRNFEAEHLELV